MRMAIAVVAVLAALATAANAQTAPGFARKPAASREGGGVKIEFAAAAPTDCAVYILDADGRAVRHLAAGVLGNNAPEPLKKDSLAQSLVWDGKDDDGKPAAGGPFKVRVGLGLTVSYGGTVFPEQTEPNRILSVLGLAAGPDGRAYVLSALHGFAHVGGTTMHVFRRDGYEKTIKPFPSNLPLERVRPTGAFRDKEGRLVPLIHLPSELMEFSPCDTVRGQQMALTPEGHLLMAVVPFVSGRPHLAAIDADGGVPYGAYAGPALGDDNFVWFAPALAVSGDAKCVYLIGMGPRSKEKSNPPAVYRVKLPERGPAEVFFGEIGKPGNDGRHLNEPRGLAVDGQGHLLVADKGNNRVIVLKEADGSLVGSFPVEAPEWVGVHPKTGAVYVNSGENILKFSNWKDGKEVARTSPKCFEKVYVGYGTVRPNFSFALDSSAERAALWIGRDKGPVGRLRADQDAELLFRCEDPGEKFSDSEPVRGSCPAPRFFSLSVDPLRREVCCMSSAGGLRILNEASGKVRNVQVKYLKGLRPSLGEGSGGFQLGRDGKIYMVAFSSPVCQFDSTTGEGIPFPSPAAQAAGGGLPGTLNKGGPGRGAHGLGVDHRGNIYVRHSIEVEKGKSVWKISVFSPEGEFLRTAVHNVLGRGMLGPRVDPKGNIYIADAIHPPDRRYPEELEPYLTGVDKSWHAYLKGWYGDFLYGSVIKFGPAGGAIWPPVRRGDKWEPGAPPPDLKMDPALKSETVHAWGQPALLQGAQWWRSGYSPQLEWRPGGNTRYMACHCVYTDFDVDDFGRVFHPDQGRFRAVVLDTNGNEVLRFGAYGNQDFRGPDSYVLDPQGNFLRPRKADDPKDLVSPFAQPEIAFGWMLGLAVTDKHAYVADHINRRVLRVKLDYAATETVSAP